VKINAAFEQASPEQIAKEILNNEGKEFDMFQDNQSDEEYEWKNNVYLKNEESDNSGLPDSGNEEEGDLSL